MLSFTFAFLAVHLVLIPSCLAVDVSIPQPDGAVLKYPGQCVTANDHAQIRQHCALWASPDGLAFNAGNRGWSIDECETHYCSSLNVKAPAQLLPQCTQSTCIKYTLGIRAGLETWLNPRVIQIFGTKMTTPVPYVFPYLMFTLRGATINTIIKERFLIVEFSAPDWGDLTEVQIFFDRKQLYQNLQPKPWFLNTGVEYVWIAKGHYNYWWNVGGQKLENQWILPRVITKEWRYNDLIDPNPVCYGRGLCGDPRAQYGYSLAYPSYQERWYMSEINGIRNNPRAYYANALNNRDSTKIKCGIDGSHPYFYDTRMGQGARFKAWERGAGLCPGTSAHHTCPQHIPWICDPVPAGSCAQIGDRTTMMSKDPCLHNYCQVNDAAPVGSALSWRADGAGFRFKAEGLGGHIGLIESDPGHCGGVLGNIRFRTAFGWFPNVKNGAHSWEPFSGSTAVNGPWPKQNTWWPNNPVYMKYNPIPTGSHKVIATTATDQTVRYLVTYWSRTNVQAKNVYVIMDDGSGGTGGINLALNQPTSQSSTGWGGVSSRAVDGNTNNRYNQGSCTHTNSDPNAWWYVDLGSPKGVATVELTNRADCCSSRLTNFDIFVTNTLPSGSYVPSATEICASSSTTVSGTQVFACSGVKTGRYVGVRLKNTGVLTLCEVAVYGASTGTGPIRKSMSLLVGNSTYGTYKFDKTYPLTAGCQSYYFKIADQANQRFLMPESGLYMYQTWGLNSCRNDFVKNMCARVGFLGCGANGVCNPVDGKCQCSNSYKGNKCQNPPGTSPCANVNCGAFGTCDTNSGQCTCTNGYMGPSCGIPSMGTLGAGDHGPINNQYFNSPANLAQITNSGQPVALGAMTPGTRPEPQVHMQGSSSTSDKGLSGGEIAGIVIGVVAAICLVACACYVCARQARVKSASRDYEMMKNQGGDYSPPQAGEVAQA